MSQQLSILLILLFPGLLPGQITLTRANLPTAGANVVTQAIDSIWLAGLDFSAVGGFRQWDFSGVQNAAERPDTTFFIEAAGTAFEDSFPEANLAVTPNPADSGAGLEYRRLTDEAFEIIGFQDTVIFNKNFSPEKRLTFPFNEKSRIEQTFDLFADAIEFQDTGTVVQLTEVDAWGQITTPLGTFECIRVKRERVENFRVFGLPVRIENTIYEFWTSEFIVPVLVYDRQSSDLFGGQDESLTGHYLTGQNVVTSRSQVYAPIRALKVFPNPAGEQITLEFEIRRSTPLKLLLFNMQGQPVFFRSLDSTLSGNNQLTLALPLMPSGFYQLVLYDKKKPVARRMVAIERP